jgi:NADH:ubiquinone oxidoreductase subunit F (NADH-binding)
VTALLPAPTHQPTGPPVGWQAGSPAGSRAGQVERRPAGPPGRLLADVPIDDPLDYASHVHAHGVLPRSRRASQATALIRTVEAAGLRGRGGAGYPLAAKLAAVAARRGPKIVVINAAESEPASGKDAVLLAAAPHLVLDGAAVAAAVIGAREVVIWLHRDPALPPAPVELAIAERARAGVDEALVRVEYGPARYVAGESSAVVSYLSGGPAKPTLTPPHATERGVLGRPTLVTNAETVAQLALLARHGPDWFRSVGTPDEPGTLLLTVTGGVRRPLVVEVPFGTSVGDVVRLAEPTGHPVAVLTGGYAGTWLPWSRAARLPVTVRDFRAAGGTLGVGLLAVLPGGRCGLAETAPLVSWLAAENAGQCGPCVNGLPAIAAAFTDLAGGRAWPGTVSRLHRWSAMVSGRGLCHHPDGVGQLVRSALQTFQHEVDVHLAGAPCVGHRLPPLLPVPLPPAIGAGADPWQ